MAKYMLLPLSVLLLLVFSCKNSDDTNPPPPEEPGIFMVVNLDSTKEYKVWGEIVNKEVFVLKPGERSKVYRPTRGIRGIEWRAPNIIDSCSFFYTPSPEFEMAMFITGTRSLFSHFSKWVPPKDKAAVRFMNISGHDSLEAVNTQNDTTVIHASTFSIPAIGFIGDSSNFIQPGNYNLQLYESQNKFQPSLFKNGVEFKSGKAYFVFVRFNNQVTVMER